MKLQRWLSIPTFIFSIGLFLILPSCGGGGGGGSSSHSSYNQDTLEGIWFTEDRYFFIDELGKLLNVEPISQEIIYDFSGNFTVVNKNVTGTVFLDHQHVGGARHSHDINYSGLFVNPDSIDMDWDVPGAGSGTQTWRRVPYAGITDQAVITEENALSMAVNAWLGGEIGSSVGFVGAVEESPIAISESLGMLDILYILDNVVLNVDLNGDSQEPIVGALVEVNETENGSCGGNLRIIGTVDDQTGEFEATMALNNFCEEGVTLDGNAEMTGEIDLLSEDFRNYLLKFIDLSVQYEDLSVTIDGRMFANFEISPILILLSYVVTDNTVANSYWLKDLIVRITEIFNNEEITDLTGRYYDPDFGYADLVLEESISINFADMWPSSGKMVLIGAVDGQGGNTKARLTFLSATEYMVEADTDGDGAYDDYSSGTQLWSEL
jgi:hypothetical protein